MTKVVFNMNDGTQREVEAREGQSLMEAAVANAIAGIDAECGGSMSCATCHCYIDEAWFAATGERSEDEADMLEFAEKEMQATSRLSCQVTITQALDGLTVTIPV